LEYVARESPREKSKSLTVVYKSREERNHALISNPLSFKLFREAMRLWVG
jgi:hypothetical protein